MGSGEIWSYLPIQYFTKARFNKKKISLQRHPSLEALLFIPGTFLKITS